MKVHSTTITAPNKKILNEIAEYCIDEVGQPDLDEENLTAFLVVRSHGDRICITEHAKELGCSVKEDIEDND